MRVLICGDRGAKAESYPNVYEYMKTLPHDTVIINGMATGVDALASGYVNSNCNSLSILKFPARWSEFGKAAGPIRNQQMLIEGKPDLVVYFHWDLNNSKGTKNMVGIAHQAGIPILGNPGTTHETRNDKYLEYNV